MNETQVNYKSFSGIQRRQGLHEGDCGVVQIRCVKQGFRVG